MPSFIREHKIQVLLQNNSLLVINKLVSPTLSQTFQTTKMNFEKLLDNKFSKTRNCNPVEILDFLHPDTFVFSLLFIPFVML